ncbi:MAG TPA: hypothetical protein VFN95_01245, partial [Flavitalea sp.]|nr:hypothetical protein [Flavitalea sp.]
STTQASTGYTIQLKIDANQLGPEAFSIERNATLITVTGGDERGLIYGSLSLCEDVRNGIPISRITAKTEKPHVPFRAIKFDLPWDTYRHSYALDLHGETCRDTMYWKAFLDMMVENRFNSLSLWNLHPYPYLIKSKNFPEASPFNDEEMKEWKTLFAAIFRMAKERAIDTYIVPFNIFVTPEFARAHNVAMDNLEHHFFVRGDTSEIIKRYTRESVTQLLQEYSDLSGMGLTLGEGMAGMTPDQRERWMRETIIEGMRLANRKSKLVHRIPFSSTTASLGVTSVETERLTRKSIEAEADLNFIEAPIWADLKFNWSHAHSTPKLIKVHGGKLYDTYFNPVPTKYKVTWTARNEDFFCLRWGSPDFVRNHVMTNTPAYVGGYFVGSETYIPAKDYFTKDTIAIPWKYAFERQWLFYKIWGRLLYNPAASNNIFKAEYMKRYGREAGDLQVAMSLASNTPLRLASLFDFTWDFSLYSEGMMALDSKVKRVEYISVDRLINQPVTDPDYVSVADYVKKNIAGGKFDKDRITPPVLSHLLEEDCKKALSIVKNVNVGGNKALAYEIADIRAWSNLGLHLSEKLKGAVALQTYRMEGREQLKQAAVQHLESALKFWDTIISITRPIYNDMPLVHYSEQDGKHWKENDHLRFHWQTIRADVARDIDVAKNAVYIRK